MSSAEEEQRPPPPQSWMVMVPFPALGHVTPMLNFARLLLLRHAAAAFRPVLALPAFVHRRMFPGGHEKEEEDGVLFASLPDGIEVDSPGIMEIEDAMENRLPAHLEALLDGLGGGGTGGGVACVVVDLVASWAIEVARGRGTPVVGFWSSMLAMFRVICAYPEMIRRGLISDDGIPPEDSPIQDIVNLRPTVTVRTLPWLIGDKALQRRRFRAWCLSVARSQPLRWVIVNSYSCEDDPQRNHSNHHHQQLIISATQIALPLAPLLQSSNTNNTVGSNNARISTRKLTFWEEDRGCLTWLSSKDPSSVIYVSFGSFFASVGPEKVHEIALGLEASGRPFLWVLRDSWREGIPEDYEERVRGRGKVVRWAPQKEVLGHEAVGCFLTHCGWNSTMEAIKHGKCMLCYPLGSDQHLNRAYVVSNWRIGLELRALERRQVSEGVNGVMKACEGEMRERMRELREAVFGDAGWEDARRNLDVFVAMLGSKEVDA